MPEDEVLPLLDAWTQGDFTVQPVDFPYLFKDEGGTSLSIELFAGAMIMSQTCDLMRPPEKRPVVQVAAIVELPADMIERVAKGYSPQYVTVAPLQSKNLAVDLDRVACVEKSVVADWPREHGCVTDEERRALATAISRHKHRFAFPDAFQAALKPMRNWVEKNRSKNTPAGEFIREMRQLRFLAADWDNLGDDLTLFCIFDEPLSVEQATGWAPASAALRKLVLDAYPHASVVFVSDTEISMRDFTTSDRFDEGLSVD